MIPLTPLILGPMSRLELLIKRMSAQRDCLNYTVDLLNRSKAPGIVVELGLGSGRTYDHLRERISGRDIFVFDYRVECHPSCVPPEDRTVLGEIQKTLPLFADQHAAEAALIHCDIGTSDRERDARLYNELTPYLMRLARPGALVASDRQLAASPGLSPLDIPIDTREWPYFLYQFNGPC